MNNFEDLLYSKTGCQWLRISKLYAQFKTQHNPFGQFCVFSPDNLNRAIRTRYYTPINRLNLNNPGLFLKNHLNSNNMFIEELPVIQIELSNLPILVVTRYYKLGVAKFKLELTGEIKMRKIVSLNKQILSSSTFNTVAYQGKNVLGNCISNDSKNDLEYNWIEQKFSFASALVGPAGTTKVSVEAMPNSDTLKISSEIEPQDIGRKIYAGVKIGKGRLRSSLPICA